MKFKLSTAGSFYTENQAEKLKKLGFTFEPLYAGYHNKDYYETDKLYKTESNVEIEFSTLEELIAFSNE